HLQCVAMGSAVRSGVTYMQATPGDCKRRESRWHPLDAHGFDSPRWAQLQGMAFGVAIPSGPEALQCPVGRGIDSASHAGQLQMGMGNPRRRASAERLHDWWTRLLRGIGAYLRRCRGFAHKIHSADYEQG